MTCPINVGSYYRNHSVLLQTCADIADPVMSVAAGACHTLALTIDGVVLAW